MNLFRNVQSQSRENSAVYIHAFRFLLSQLQPPSLIRPGTGGSTFSMPIPLEMQIKHSCWESASDYIWIQDDICRNEELQFLQYEVYLEQNFSDKCDSEIP